MAKSMWTPLSVDKRWQQSGSYTEELSDFKCGTVIRCHFAVIVKWMRLGATTAQPQSGRRRKLTEPCRLWKQHKNYVSGAS